MVPSPKKRVVVLESDQVLAAGVQSFLATQDNLDVFGIEENDEDAVFQAITELKPDVIILDKLIQVTDLNALMSYLKDFPKVRAIIVNGSDNQIQVCERQQIQVHQISDILAFL